MKQNFVKPHAALCMGWFLHVYFLHKTVFKASKNRFRNQHAMCFVGLNKGFMWAAIGTPG